MKLSIILSLACIFTPMATVLASPPPVFQIRLVLDKPSADSEPMTEIAHHGYAGETNVLNVQKTVLLDQTALESAIVVRELGRNNIYIIFNKSGAVKFAKVTRQNVMKRLAIIINGEVCEAPRVHAEISSGEAEISGSFSEQEAEAIVKQLNDAVAKP